MMNDLLRVLVLLLLSVLTQFAYSQRWVDNGDLADAPETTCVDARKRFTPKYESCMKIGNFHNVTVDSLAIKRDFAYHAFVESSFADFNKCCKTVTRACQVMNHTDVLDFESSGAKSCYDKCRTSTVAKSLVMYCLTQCCLGQIEVIGTSKLSIISKAPLSPIPILVSTPTPSIVPAPTPITVPTPTPSSRRSDLATSNLRKVRVVEHRAALGASQYTTSQNLLPLVQENLKRMNASMEKNIDITVFPAYSLLSTVNFNPQTGAAWNHDGSDPNRMFSTFLQAALAVSARHDAHALDSITCNSQPTAQFRDYKDVKCLSNTYQSNVFASIPYLPQIKEPLTVAERNQGLIFDNDGKIAHSYIQMHAAEGESKYMVPGPANQPAASLNSANIQMMLNNDVLFWDSGYHTGGSHFAYMSEWTNRPSLISVGVQQAFSRATRANVYAANLYYPHPQQAHTGSGIYERGQALKYLWGTERATEKDVLTASLIMNMTRNAKSAFELDDTPTMTLPSQWSDKIEVPEPLKSKLVLEAIYFKSNPTEASTSWKDQKVYDLPTRSEGVYVLTAFDLECTLRMKTKKSSTSEYFVFTLQYGNTSQGVIKACSFHSIPAGSIGNPNAWNQFHYRIQTETLYASIEMEGCVGPNTACLPITVVQGSTTSQGSRVPLPTTEQSRWIYESPRTTTLYVGTPDKPLSTPLHVLSQFTTVDFKYDTKQDPYKTRRTQWSAEYQQSERERIRDILKSDLYAAGPDPPNNIQQAVIGWDYSNIVESDLTDLSQEEVMNQMSRKLLADIAEVETPQFQNNSELLSLFKYHEYDPEALDEYNAAILTVHRRKLKGSQPQSVPNSAAKPLAASALPKPPTTSSSSKSIPSRSRFLQHIQSRRFQNTMSPTVDKSFNQASYTNQLELQASIDLQTTLQTQSTGTQCDYTRRLGKTLEFFQNLRLCIVLADVAYNIGKPVKEKTSTGVYDIPISNTNLTVRDKDFQYTLSVIQAIGAPDNPNTPLLGKINNGAYFVAHNANESILYVVFRGTQLGLVSPDLVSDVENLGNMKEYGMPNSAEKFALHPGFARLAKSLKYMAVIKTAIQRGLKFNKIIVVGHSLGGALATIASWDIQRTFGPTYIVEAVTFGSPRVGDVRFRHDFLQRVLHTRVVNDVDVISMVPLRGGFRSKLKYYHAAAYSIRLLPSSYWNVASFNSDPTNQYDYKCINDQFKFSIRVSLTDHLTSHYLGSLNEMLSRKGGVRNPPNRKVD